MIFITIFLIWERIVQIQAIRSGFWDNLAYTTSQTDFELARLIDTLVQAEAVDGPEQSERVFIRYEVALSRLIGMTKGNTGERILANDSVREFVLSTLRSLEALEEEVLAFTSLPADRRDAVLKSLREISADFHRATVRIASLGDRDQAAFFLSLASAARFEILMLGLIGFAGALAFTNAFLERRRFSLLNQRLSDTVEERTAELAEKNEKLAAEIEERSRVEQRFRSLFEHATEAVVITDLDHGYLIEANPRAEALFGLPRERLIGVLGLAELSPVAQPDGQRSDERLRAYLNDAIEGDFPSFEWMHRSADGVEVPCQVTFARFPDSERRLVRGSLIDLSERKRAEVSLRKLENQLAQAQKLEAIGQMTGGVAHDFNNLLSVIVGNLELLSDNTDDDGSHALIQAAFEASMRGADLTRSMLNFARRAHLQPEDIDLGELVQNMDRWISRTIPAVIRLKRSIKPDLWPVRADVAGTESAVLNLVLNARDAMPDGGSLVIEAENLEIEQSAMGEISDGLTPGRYVMIAVSDTGHGIPQKALDKVFDPFFSTKNQNNNSGLGLSMVHGFMSQTGGAVRIYTEVGVGTTVKLFFPASDDGNRKEIAAEHAAQKPPYNARILVAEDQRDVLAVLQLSLERLGHTVFAAENGDAAESLFAQSAPIDLLVTDIVMPGELQGPALAKRLRVSDPQLPVIFMSGYASEAALHGNGLRADDIRLMKPVARKRLVRAVNSALRPRHEMGPERQR